jgi:hypothetical protein
MALLSLCADVFAIFAIAIVALMTMALLPLSRYPCCYEAGVVSLVTMTSSTLIHNSVVALIMMVLLPSSSWSHCPCCNGIVVINDVVALIDHCQAGVGTLVVMVLLPSMCRCLPVIVMEIVALITMALLPLLMRRRLCRC